MQNFLDSVQNEHREIAQNTRFITDTVISAVLNMKCFTLKDLQAIADKMHLTSYKQDSSSFKLSYRALGHSIHRQFNVSFGMVEGLHRIFTVKNVLEGRLLPNQVDEPVLRNIFLDKKVKIRLHILDKLTEQTLSQFSALSLLYLKVKRASVQRTLFDELNQIILTMQRKSEMVNLRDNAEALSQQGKHVKDGSHILYNQRLFIYTFITAFALNDKKSTVLYKHQLDHISRVITSPHISDKLQFLGLDNNVKLSDEDLFAVVGKVIMSNIAVKAQEFAVICTKNTTRNNDWSMKPLCQELRIVLSYYVLAALGLPSIEASTRIFSTTYKFAETQTKDDIDILSTMYTIVHSIDNVVSVFRKQSGILAQEIHATKIDQLLEMNLFQDVLTVIKSIGHKPEIDIEPIRKLCCNIEDEDVKQSVLIELLQAWNIQVTTYLKDENSEVVSKMKDDLYNVCRATDRFTKTDMKLGKFATGDISAYSVNEKLSFSFFVRNVLSSSLDIYIVPKETAADKPTWEDINQEYVFDPPNDSIGEIMHHDEDGSKEDGTVSHKNLSPKSVSNMSPPKERGMTKCDTIRVNTLTNKPSPQKLAPIFDAKENQSKDKRKVNDVKANSGRKKQKVDKKMFDVPQAVATIYHSAITKEDLNIPVDRDLFMIREAWKSTIDSITTATALKTMWEVHRMFLFDFLTRSEQETRSQPEARSQSIMNPDIETNSITDEPASTPSSLTFAK